jgi:hypothetical protein
MRVVNVAAVLALAVSVTTCRLDKLINPATADRVVVNPAVLQDSAHVGSLDAETTIVRVRGADGIPLTWHARKTAAWVTLSPSPDSLVVLLHPDTLSQTPHQDTIVFWADQSKDTVRVPVLFNMLAAQAKLVVSPTKRDTSAYVGSARPDTFSLRIKNTGALPLTWTASLNATWVTLSDSGGTVPPQDTTSTVVLVTLRPDSLTTGPKSARIIISAPGAINASDTVPISYRIDPCAETTILTLDATRSGSIALSDCGAPQRAGRQAKLYSVQAAAADTLTLRLSAAFDAYLVLTDSFGTSLRQNNDCSAPAGPACILAYPVTTTGRYIIEVTTAAAGETGAFSLSVVKERVPNAPQGALQFRKDSTTAIGVGAITLQDTVVFKATVNDSNPGDSVRLEIEVLQTISTFLGSPTDSSAFVSVAAGARSVAVRVPPSGSPALQDNARYHWQTRTCDKTGRCSAWGGFGQNPDSSADFVVNSVLQDPVLDSVSLNQYNGASTTPLPVGQGTGGALGTTQTVTFKGMVTDPDPGDNIVLEVEVKATGTAFDGSSLMRGAGVTSGSNAAASFSTTVDLLVTKTYHWRAHACDQAGRCGPWVSFGNNAESATDFQVP